MRNGYSQNIMKNSPDKIPPQNIEAEIAVLGSILLDKNLIDIAGEKLKPEHFYSKEHQLIFRAILDLYNDDKPVDLISLTDKLKKKGELEKIGGASFLSTIISSIPTPANIEHYAAIVREKAILRELIDVSSDIINKCYAGKEDGAKLLDKAEQNIFNIAQQKISSGFVSIKELISMEFIDELVRRKEHITGLPTGFRDLDERTSGLHPSELILIAGRPSMGKTSLALNIARNVAVTEKKPVAIFSLEMSKEQVAERLLCMESRVDSHKMRTGYLSEEDEPKLSISAGILFDAPIFIDDSSSLNALELRAKTRRLKAKQNISLMVVDYIQLMSSETVSENRQQEIAEISRALKGIARELQIPVIAVSQLSRRVETRGEDRRPILSDLRESGALEQDADVVMLLLREEYYKPDDEEVKGKAEINIAKQRNGPTGTIKLSFIKQYTRFEDLAYTSEE